MDKDIKDEIKRLGQNPKINWRGQLALYGGAALVALYPSIKAFVTTGDPTDTEPRPTVIADGSISPEQKAKIEARHAQNPNASAQLYEQLKKEACAKQPTHPDCKDVAAPAAQSATPAPVRTPEQQRLVQAAQINMERQNEGKIDINGKPIPKDLTVELFRSGTDLALAFLIATVASRVTRRFTGYTLPQHIYGPRTPNVNGANLAAQQEHNRRQGQIHEAHVHGALDKRTADRNVDLSKLEETQQQIPDQWFGRARAKTSSLLGRQDHSVQVSGSAPGPAETGWNKLTTVDSNGRAHDSWYRPSPEATRLGIANRKNSTGPGPSGGTP